MSAEGERKALSLPTPEQPMHFTGERYTAGVQGEIEHEHLHRTAAEKSGGGSEERDEQQRGRRERADGTFAQHLFRPPHDNAAAITSSIRSTGTKVSPFFT